MADLSNFTIESPVEEEHEYENGYGVLLYYKYTTSPIPDLQELLNFYQINCTSLSLLGRVRLSPLGVNVTVCFAWDCFFSF